MRLRTFGLAAVLATSLFQPTGAVVRPKGAEAPIVAADRGARLYRDVVFSSARRGGMLSNRLAADGLAGWNAQWDRDTDVPLRMWGSGIVFSGSVANAATAESAARQFLAQHLATLAPGASASDFQLVSNELNAAGDLRSIGFHQRSHGVRVLGGSVGFAFKADRLVMVSSTALPNIKISVPTTRLAATASRVSAVRWLGEDGYPVTARDRASDQTIVPIIRPKHNGKRSIEYRLAEQLEVDAVTEPGTWVVWVDATTGAPIARKSGIRYANGKVLFDVSDRHPAGARSPQPAPFARFTIGADTVTAAADGTISWLGTSPVNVQLTPAGQFVTVTNKGAQRVSEMVSLAANATFNWTKATVEFEDAQISSYVYANQAKVFTKARLNPTLSWLNANLSVTVNESSTCNAYSTGDDIHFFRKGGGCENTGRLSDVVYHEFGHSLHANSIINGVGDFDGALSEGIADTLAMAITNDHGMGRGFFLDNRPLRDLDPTNGEKIWGIHTTGEVHTDGEIYGGTMWDLKVALEASLGTEAGYERFLKIYYTTVQRASDIPSSYAEALLADDDDGNLENGTPNECAIVETFAAHGLADLLSVEAPIRDGNQIVMPTPTAAHAGCAVPTVASAQIEFRKRGDAMVQLVDMVDGAAGYTADLPTLPDGSVAQYRINFRLSNNTTLKFPNNPADPFYEYFVGNVEPIKCFDFEDGLQGWTASTDWQVAAPEGLGGDPSEAYGGSQVLGLDLTNDGEYRNRSTTSAESPEIDLGGATKVRLQYRRHLGVEDGVFDQARILANGTEVWKNFVSPSENGSTHHLDKEWVFQDIDLATQATTGKLKLKFEIDSDDGLSFGGWTLDDVCVVRLADAPLPGEEEGGGCCSSSGAPAGSLLLGLATVGLVIRRRRRR